MTNGKSQMTNFTPPPKPGQRWELEIKSKKGIALILALVILLILAVIVMEFSYYLQVRVSLSENFVEETKALYLARAGIQYGIALLEKDDEPSYDALSEEWAVEELELPLGGGKITLSIEDEESKVNINYLLAGRKNKDYRLRQLERLCRLLELDEEATPSIKDWIDSDDEVTVIDGARGAEDDYYRRMESPYPCKNGKLDTLGELYLVKGIKGETLPRSEDEDLPSLEDCFTIYGKGKVNLNTAPLIVLQSLADNMDEEKARAIIDYRVDNPLKSISELKNIIGSSLAGKIEKEGLVDVKSRAFRIIAVGEAGGIKRRIESVVEREGGKIGIKYWRAE